MSRTVFRELPEAMDQLDSDPEVIAAVITGAGEGFFAGGAIADFDALTDLQSFRAQPDATLGAFSAVEPPRRSEEVRSAVRAFIEERQGRSAPAPPAGGLSEKEATWNVGRSRT